MRSIQISFWKIIFALILAMLGLLLFFFEREWNVISIENIYLTVLSCVVIWSFLASISRRAVASAFVALTIMAAIAFSSKVKFSYLSSTLHAMDIMYYIQAPVELAFLFTHYPAMMSAGMVVLVAGLGLLLLVFKLEPASIKGVSRVIVFAAGVAGSIVLIAKLTTTQPNRAYQQSYDALHISSFLYSIPEAISFYSHFDNFRRVESSDGAAPQPGPLPAVIKPPNIIVILHESTIDPQDFVNLDKTKVDSGLFASGDARARKLIVETYGGVTWISEYGLLLGVSTHSFGSVRSYLGHFMSGQFKNALPHYLSRLGYGTIAVYPAPSAFANTGNFYKSLGFERVIDFRDMRPSFWVERDSFYYNHGLAEIKARREAGDVRPVFLTIATMATHGPYTNIIFPDVRQDEARPGDSWAEYARRLRISHDDLKSLYSRLEREFPEETFLIVGYGDHQPVITKEFDKEVFRYGAGEMSDRRSLAKARFFETFYRINGIRFNPRFEKVNETTEIGLLGTMILRAAGLPLQGSYDTRSKLIDGCEGLLFRCAKQELVKWLHRELADSGEIRLPDRDFYP